MDQEDKAPVCGFCRAVGEREEIFMGKISYGTKCVTCGATEQHSAKKIREQGYLAAGESSSPFSVVGDLLRDPYYLITGKKTPKKNTD